MQSGKFIGSKQNKNEFYRYFMITEAFIDNNSEVSSYRIFK